MGNAADEFDDMGRKKVRCMECNPPKYFHRLDVHLPKHSLSVADYMALHPGVAVLSESAAEAGGVGAQAVKKLLDRAKEEGDATELKFGVATLKIRKKLADEDLAWVPEHDDDWEAGAADATALEALATAMQDDDNVLIVGPPGVGKSSLARELAYMTHSPLRRLGFTGDVRVSDLMGSKELLVDPKSGQSITSFGLGPIPIGAKRGHWFLFDEFDSCPPPVGFVLHGFLEGPRHLVIPGYNNGAPLEISKRTRVIATANTVGYGDESGLYAGTAPLNEALLDRFGVVIRMGYPEKSAEANMLAKRNNISLDLATKMVEVATKVREAQATQTTTVALSTRRLIAWASKSARFGESRARYAAQITILNKLPQDDMKFIDGIIQRVIGGASV